MLCLPQQEIADRERKVLPIELDDVAKVYVGAVWWYIESGTPTHPFSSSLHTVLRRSFQ